MKPAGEGQRNNSTAIRYAIGGVIALLFMALTSGIDASFVYIFLGLAAGCFFMTFYLWASNRKWNTGQKKQQRSYQQTYTPPPPPRNEESADDDPEPFVPKKQSPP